MRKRTRRVSPSSKSPLDVGLAVKVDETADRLVWIVDLAKMLLYGSVYARGNFVGESRIPTRFLSESRSPFLIPLSP